MYIVVLDQGTTSSRAVLYDLNGSVKAQASRKVSAIYPKPGWVEQSPEEIWQSSLACLQEVCAQIPIECLRACAITNQRETTIAWNASTNQCYGPAIVWQDRRTQVWCERFQSENELINDKTGLKVDPYFSASKIKWILDHYPEIKLSDLKFGTVDSFLIWRLTGAVQHRTDITNAARTLLFNINTHRWDQELLDLFAIPASILPEVCDSDQAFGYLEKSILGREIPILAVIGDQQAALIGVGCCQPKDTKVTFGTGGFVMQNLGSKRPSEQVSLLTTVAYKIKKQLCYALEGSIYDAGSAIDWLQQSLGFIESYQDLSLRLSHLSSNEGVYFIPAFSGLGAPHWLSEPGAMFVGLSRASNQNHLIRAVVESIAYQTQDILSMIDATLELKVDGGMIENQWFLQFLADLTGRTIHLPNTHENTAKGAALVAAIHLGEGSSIEQLSSQWQTFQAIHPNQTVSHEMAYLGWKKVMKRFSVYQQV